MLRRVGIHFSALPLGPGKNLVRWNQNLLNLLKLKFEVKLQAWFWVKTLNCFYNDNLFPESFMKKLGCNISKNLARQVDDDSFLQNNLL